MPRYEAVLRSQASGVRCAEVERWASRGRYAESDNLPAAPGARRHQRGARDEGTRSSPAVSLREVAFCAQHAAAESQSPQAARFTTVVYCFLAWPVLSVAARHFMPGYLAVALASFVTARSAWFAGSKRFRISFAGWADLSLLAGLVGASSNFRSTSCGLWSRRTSSMCFTVRGGRLAARRIHHA